MGLLLLPDQMGDGVALGRFWGNAKVSNDDEHCCHPAQLYKLSGFVGEFSSGGGCPSYSALAHAL